MNQMERIRSTIGFVHEDAGTIKWPMHVFVQNYEEACEFINFVINTRERQRPSVDPEPIRFMEIGVRLGGSFAFWGRALRNFYHNVEGIALDLPCALHEGNHTEPLDECLVKLKCNFKYNIILADSHLQSSLDRTKEILAGNKLDMLFIDGDHSEDGVTQDFEMYSTLVKPGGVVGFHDIVEPKDWPWVQVHAAWPKIRGRFDPNNVREWKHEGKRFGIGAMVL